MGGRTAARLIASLIVFAVSAEIVGLAAYYIDTGALFYTHRRAYEEPLPAPEDRLVLSEAVHPYFGFTHRPGAPFDIPESLRSDPAASLRRRTNNFGFVSTHDYPFARTGTNQLLLGIFGGSVGVWFCEVGAPRLVESLKRHPYFAAREVVPLCFSHEGYKQPQQSIVLDYFLARGQSLDLAVNIDGFNDVALAVLNNRRAIDFSMPSVQHLDPLLGVVNQSALTPDKLQSLAAIWQDRRLMLDLIARIRATRSASVAVVIDRYYRAVRSRYVRELGRFSNLPSNPVDNAFVQVAPPLRPLEGSALFEDIAGVWVRSSAIMHELLTERGAGYFHFLQPNQYYTERTFTPAEAEVALNDASPYKASVAEGYPILVRAAGTLGRQGVRFFDATHVFDHERKPVYMDNCCHYTLVGNQVLADFIAASILGTPGPWRN
ncbi:MAG: hypothetical protein A3F70_15005 [Acidobacteria bacterium RIFCSPLOWO2_12_FULL_67_14]|nr:MAG: hypothetical protein A3H29_12160 [Acidobacteria bacterium RIFCSPLOWO2_02_FULL_67_21]OFW35803.1 MAG: hypothetical protein A3F70_15005 [Acidobacteria bacterium RIFCSPLOWO2_12_FULL_67_14]